MDKKEPKPDTKTEQPPEKPEAPKSPEQQRAERIGAIEQDLNSYEGPQDDRELEARATEIRQQYEHASEGVRISDETKAQLDEKMQAELASLRGRFSEYKDKQVEKTALEYVSKVLEGESSKSYIERPMDKECKVAVMVPAYNETTSTILRSLSSLSIQEGINPNMFEVDVVVNNKKRDAQEQTDAFLANQETIKLIKFINGEGTTIPEGLTPEQIEQIEKIRDSKIVVNVIDKSSTDTAYEENNVGIARNRAGAEIIDRFLNSSAQTDGIVAITDSDCIFSPNYVRSLIQSFDEHRINGVSGNLEFEIDPSLPNKELIQRAFDIYMGKEGPKKDYSDEPSFKIQAEGALMSGANMAVSARSWAQVDGMPPLAGGEDIRFGQSVEKLPGQVAKNYDYTTTSLIRVSERTGLQGNGRIVKKIKESIDAYLAGETDKIVIEDREAVNSFFNGVISASTERRLTGKLIMDLMTQNNFKPSEIAETEFNELATEINQELGKPEAERDYRKIERMALEKIYPFYPERDVTEKLGI